MHIECFPLGKLIAYFFRVIRLNGSGGLQRWPSQRESEMPDCGLFSCNYRDGQENVFTDDQREIVAIYEVGLSACLCTYTGTMLSVGRED